MAFFGKEYKFVSSENFEDFIRSCGLPEVQTKQYISYKPTQKLTKDGDKYTFTTATPTGSKALVFTSGVEFDEEKIGNIASKSTITVDGNVVTQVQKLDNGNIITFKREFNGDDLVVTLTNSTWGGVAKRFYKV